MGQIAVVFGSVAILCLIIFSSASFFIHGLFSLHIDHGFRMASLVANIRSRV